MNEEFEDYLRRQEKNVFYKNNMPIWDSLKLYDDTDEQEWIEHWMKERFYDPDCFLGSYCSFNTKELLKDIVESRLGNDPLRDFRLMFYFAKEALGLSSKQLIQVIDLYEKQFRDTDLIVQSSILKAFFDLNDKKNSEIADNYTDYKDKRISKKEWLQRHKDIESRYEVERESVVKQYTDFRDMNQKQFKSFAEILLDYRQGKYSIENKSDYFNEVDSSVFDLIHTPIEELYPDYVDTKKAGESVSYKFSNERCYYAKCFLETLSDEHKTVFNEDIIRKSVSDSCYWNPDQEYCLYKDIITLVEGISEEEFERLYNLFTVMKKSFAKEDEEIPDDWHFDGKFDPDEAERREELIWQRDKIRLRKLLQKVKDERD